MGIEEIVADFVRHWRPIVKKERESFSTQPNLKAAVRKAALCTTDEGKRESHQRRLSAEVLKQAERELQKTLGRLGSSTSFDELQESVKQKIRTVRGIGDLTVYDVAARIGAFLNLRPAAVYLHAGTAVGAKRLGIRGRVASTTALPPAFGKLDPDEIESCLCIYKDCLPGGSHEKHSAKSCFSAIRPPCGGGRRIC